MQEDKQTNSAVRSFMTIGTLYSCLYCMLASNVMLSMPILGGTLYLAGRCTTLFGMLRHAAREGIVSKTTRTVCMTLLAILFLAVLALMTVYPIGLDSADFWRLAGIVLCIILRPSVTRYVLERALMAHKKTMNILLRIFAVQLMFLPPLLLMLLLSDMTRIAVWSLIGGYAVSGILESFPLDRMRDRMRTVSEEDRQDAQALMKVHAFKIFRIVMLAITAALQVTQAMSFAYIAVSADALILCMVIALLCTYVASAVADAALRALNRKSDPNVLMVVGLFIWFSGLLLFSRTLNTPGSMTGYLSLALCTVGATTCVRVLVRLEEDMRRVAAFGIGHTPGKGVDKVQQVHVDLAALLGQAVALLGLTLISIFTTTDFPNDWEKAFRSFSPLLTLPALALVAVAILFALLFPLTKEHLSKLRRYSELQRQAKENGPLHDQLEAVVVQRSLKHYGVKLIVAVMRPFYYHKIKGKENLHLDDDIPCVFVCNHGEVYGPIVTNLYVPFSFRPWVAYEMTDKQVIVNHTMNGAFQKVTGRRRKILNWLMNHIGAPFLTWIMRSVDSIPVYHDNPRKLMQTFRETTAAMEAGDNILLFPENADTSADHRYVKEGVSDFFTGFTMIGQLYQKKTGKCPLFVPLYADKHKRVITFGVPTRYNADVPPNEEKDRLCEYLRGEMLRIAREGQETGR